MIAVVHREVLPFDDARDLLFQRGGIHQQVAHADALLHVFVGIDRRDAAAGGAELGVAQAVLLEDVHLLMIGHADDRLVADAQVGGCDVDALFLEARKLAH